MLCPECVGDGRKEKVMADLQGILRCGGCRCECTEPIIEPEDVELLKIASRYERVYKYPFGYAIERAAESEAKLGMMMYRIYEKWQNNPNINPDMVINTTIKFILEFSKENAKKELEKISKELINNQKADLQLLFKEINSLMDKIMEMMTTVNKIDGYTK